MVIIIIIIITIVLLLFNNAHFKLVRTCSALFGFATAFTLACWRSLALSLLKDATKSNRAAAFIVCYLYPHQY